MNTESDAHAGEIEAYPAGILGVELRVPVEVEVPEALVEAARGRYELERLQGKDPDFADFLADVIMFDPEYQVNGVEIDMEGGRPMEDDK